MGLSLIVKHVVIGQFFVKLIFIGCVFDKSVAGLTNKITKFVYVLIGITRTGPLSIYSAVIAHFRTFTGMYW